MPRLICCRLQIRRMQLRPASRATARTCSAKARGLSPPALTTIMFLALFVWKRPGGIASEIFARNHFRDPSAWSCTESAL